MNFKKKLFFKWMFTISKFGKHFSQPPPPPGGGGGGRCWMVPKIFISTFWYLFFSVYVLGAQLSSRCFFDENAVLLWENDDKWIIQSIAHRYLQLLSIFLVELEYRYSRSVHLLRLSMNQAIFRCLDMSGTADQPYHVPSTGTNNNRTAQCLGNTAGGVGLPIWAFLGRF